MNYLSVWCSLRFFNFITMFSQLASSLIRVRPRHIRGLRRSSINDGRVHKTSPTCHVRTEDPAQTNTHHSQMCWIFSPLECCCNMDVYSREQPTDFSDFVVLSSAFETRIWHALISQKCFFDCFFFSNICILLLL